MSHKSVKTPGRTSPTCDSHSTARSEKFPSTISLSSTDAPQDPDFIRMLQEDKIKVMRTRTTALFNENVYLKTQIYQERIKTKELENRLVEMGNRVIQNSASVSNPEHSRECKTQFTNTEMRPEEMTIKGPFTCHACRKKFMKDDGDDPIVFITKTELSNLEKDVKELRDSLELREKAWDGMMEREQNYSRQLTRLAQEIITVNQLAENRSNDLENIAIALQEREGELKIAQKEIIALQKLVAKLDKRNRALKENGEERTMTEMNERDRKWIETIVRQISTPRGRQKSKESYYSTPRSVKNSAREETTTVTDT